MRLLVAPLLALLVLAAGSPIAAQAPDRGLDQVGVPVTEAAFLAPFGEESAAFRALSGELGARRADLAAARLLDDPTLSAGREEADESTESELTVAWRPPRPDRRRLAVAAAEADLAAAEAGRDSSLVLLRLELRSAYAGWAVAARRVEHLEAELEVLRELTRWTGERAEAGEASLLEHRRLLLAVAEAEARMAGARAERASAEAAARAWRPDLPPGSAPVLPALSAPSASSTSSPATHPTLASLQSAARAAELREELAGKVLDLPELVAGWKWVDPGPSPGGAPGERAETVGGPVIGLAWRVPLFDRGEVERLRAGAEREALEARLELAERRLAAEAEGARAAYDELRRAAGVADGALSAAEPAVAAATLAFRLGEADLTTLLETVRSAAAARLAALEIHAEALAAGRELDRLLASTDSSTDHSTEGDAP